MVKQEITLKIAGMSFSLTINREKEEVYRLAEREVNAYLAQIKSSRIKDWKAENYLAVTALHFAIEQVNLRRQREVDNDDLRDLEALSTEIDAYLNAPDR